MMTVLVVISLEFERRKFVALLDERDSDKGILVKKLILVV